MDKTLKISEVCHQSGGIAVVVGPDKTRLVISYDMASRYHLQEGVILTSAQLEKLKQEADLFQCDNRAARLLAQRDHSIGEFKEKLRRLRFSSTSITVVTKKYKAKGMLDDAHFAYKAARSLLDRRPCGRAYMVAHLQKRRIDPDLAAKTADLLLKDWQQSELALRALQSRWPRVAQFELEVARRKAYNYLARRGFGYEAAKAAFDQLWSGKQEEPRD